jgi:hypothetical protein
MRGRAPIGTFLYRWCFAAMVVPGRPNVNGLIYLIGTIVVILFILSFLGLR